MTQNNLPLSRTVFLGGAAADEAIGVVVNSTNTIVAAINTNGVGNLLRLSTAVGTTPLSQTTLGEAVRDMDIIRGTNTTQKDRIVVVGSFGLRVYEADGTTLVWSQSGSFDQVAVANDGTVVTLQRTSDLTQDTLQRWQQSGTGAQQLGSNITVSQLTGGTSLTTADLAISRDGTQIYVTGYTQFNSPILYQSPFIRAYNTSGVQLWDTWNYDAALVNQNSLTADSTGLKITLGLDDKLYFLGSMDGGNTVLTRNGDTITTNLGSLLKTSISPYNDTSNTSGAKTFGYYSEINPSDGSVVQAQVLVTRLSSGQANSYGPGAITADTSGTVYLGGTAYASLYNRSNQTVNSQPVGSYSGGEVSLFSTDSSFTTLNYWTPLVNQSAGVSGDNGNVAAIAVGNGFQVALVTATQPSELVTVADDSAVTPLGENDVYLAVMGTPLPSTVVTNTNDSGAGSLREVLATAAAGSTITFASNLANQIITLTSELNLTQDVTIDGSGIEGLTLSGGNAVRIFNLTHSGINVNLKNLILADGNATTGTGEDRGGGAIRGASNTVLSIDQVTFRNNIAGFGGAIYTGFTSTNIITNSTFENNNGSIDGAERGGGAIATKSNGSLTVLNSTFTGNQGTNGGAINSLLGALTIENSTFTNNTTTGYGGAIYTDGANASGPNYTPGAVGGTIAIRNSVFDQNQGAGQGGGLFLFGYAQDQVNVDNSTITNNRVITDSRGDALGGGIRIGTDQFTLTNTTLANNIALSQGGGLWIGEDSQGTIANSTFSRNDAQGSSGLGGAIVFANGSNPVSVVNTTVAYNNAGFQGGAFWGGGSNITLTNTLVAYTTAGNPWNVKVHTGTPFSDGGGNLQWPSKNASDSSDLNITNSANLKIVDPLLDENLIDNGGGVLTHGLLSGSPAINGGVATGAPTQDERGSTRDSVPDIGAFEFTTTVPSITLAVSPGGVAEDGTANLVYTFSRSGSATSGLTVNYTVTGTATFNNDYTQAGSNSFSATTGTVTFAPGSSTATVTIAPNADTIVENDETIALTLTSSTDYRIGTIEAVTGTITNDDSNSNLFAVTTPIDTNAAANTISENAPNGSLVGITANATDADSTNNTVTYSLADDGGGLFTINSNTGVVTIVSPLDYEGAAFHNITVEATSSDGSSRSETFTIAVSDVNEAPTGVTLSNPVNGIAENSDTTTRIKVADIAITDDALGTNTIALSGVDAANFEVVGTELYLKAGVVLNSTTQASYVVTVAVDDTVVGTTPDAIANFTLTVTEVKNPEVLFGTPQNDSLDATTGQYTVIPYEGDDTIVVNTASDVILELPSQGTDTIVSNVNYNLAAQTHLENLTLTGTDDISGIGNRRDNVITGNSGQNVLVGLQGDDTFVFNFGDSTIAKPDRIRDFGVGDDRLQIGDQLLLTQQSLNELPSKTDSNVATLIDLVNSVFVDANGSLSGNQPLGINSAALGTYTSLGVTNTYLIVNDGIDGFNAETDLIINIARTTSDRFVGGDYR